MTKRLVDVDDELVTEARQVLGTKTLKDTVNTALRKTVSAERPATIDWDRFADACRDLGDREVMGKAWE